MSSFVRLALSAALLICPYLCGADCAMCCGPCGAAQTDAESPREACCERCGCGEARPPDVANDESSAPVAPSAPERHECTLDCLCKGAVKHADVGLDSLEDSGSLSMTVPAIASVPAAFAAGDSTGPPGGEPNGRSIRCRHCSLRC